MDRVKETVSCAPRSASASGQARQQVLQAAGASPKGSQRSPAQGAAPSQISAGGRAALGAAGRRQADGSAGRIRPERGVGGTADGGSPAPARPRGIRCPRIRSAASRRLNHKKRQHLRRRLRQGQRRLAAVPGTEGVGMGKLDLRPGQSALPEIKEPYGMPWGGKRQGEYLPAACAEQFGQTDCLRLGVLRRLPQPPAVAGQVEFRPCGASRAA